MLQSALVLKMQAFSLAVNKGGESPHPFLNFKTLQYENTIGKYL